MPDSPMLDSVAATRYVTPLREGGSLPGLMEADDLGTYVVKYRGAGQGPKALLADVIAGELARSLGLPVPRMVTVAVDPVLAANEPDEEVQALLRASGGANLGVDFLPGSLDLDAATAAIDPGFAGRVLWFDALVGNVDRSWRNPNLLLWHGRPHLIDHGAALTFHHAWPKATTAPAYDASEHALLGAHPDTAAAEAVLAPQITTALLQDAVALAPDDWLATDPALEQGHFGSVDDLRAAYVAALRHRFTERAGWLHAIGVAAARGPVRIPARRGTNRPGWLR